MYSCGPNSRGGLIPSHTFYLGNLNRYVTWITSCPLIKQSVPFQILVYCYDWNTHRLFPHCEICRSKASLPCLQTSRPDVCVCAVLRGRSGKSENVYLLVSPGSELFVIIKWRVWYLGFFECLGSEVNSVWTAAFQLLFVQHIKQIRNHNTCSKQQYRPLIRQHTRHTQTTSLLRRTHTQ